MKEDFIGVKMLSCNFYSNHHGQTIHEVSVAARDFCSNHHGQTIHEVSVAARGLNVSKNIKLCLVEIL